MSEQEPDFVPESSGPIVQALKMATVVSIGSGIALFLISVRPYTTSGAQRSVQIEWEKRQLEINNTIGKQQETPDQRIEND